MASLSKPDFIVDQHSLSRHTTWKVGGMADHFAQPRSLEELKSAWQWAATSQLPVTILGGGSNVLISDAGIRGLVLCLSKFVGTSHVERAGRLEIEAWAGTSKLDLLKIFLRYKLAPALFLAGIPGNVGGGVVMNAGVSEQVTPREFVEIVDWFEVLRWDGHVFTEHRFNKADVQWSYRHCLGWQPGVITRVQVSWPLEPIDAIPDRVKEANRIRMTKQPLEMPSCGSVFVNPVGGKAGQLIESSGLKGYSVGGAQVSPKHANFIVNTGQARASEIDQIIRHVQGEVKSKTGFDLHTEVVYLGEWD